MLPQKHPSSRDSPPARAPAIEAPAEQRLRRCITRERRKVESHIKNLSLGLQTDMGVMKHEILHAVRENEQSIEVLARELARRRREK